MAGLSVWRKPPRYPTRWFSGIYKFWQEKSMMFRAVAFLLVLNVAFFAGAETESPGVSSWDDGLGETEHSLLAFRFKATFLKIEVADIDARLAPQESAQLAALVAEGKADKERIKQAAKTLLEADTIAFRFVFLREGGIDRFMNGTNKSLEAARKAKVISPDEYEVMWAEYQATFEVIDERGFLEGDQLIYRVENDAVRVIYLGIDGDVLVDTIHSDNGWARGIKGSFLADKVKFQKDLVGSLWD
jgi:hypothetical protein